MSEEKSYCIMCIPEKAAFKPTKKKGSCSICGSERHLHKLTNAPENSLKTAEATLAAWQSVARKLGEALEKNKKDFHEIDCDTYSKTGPLKSCSCGIADRFTALSDLAALEGE